MDDPDDKEQPCYTMAVDIVHRIALQTEMPADGEVKNLVYRQDNLKVGQLLGSCTREQIAKAMHTELKYAHPVEWLRILGFSRDEAALYVRGQRTMAEILALKPLDKPREQVQKTYAIEADREHRAFMGACAKERFCFYTTLQGTNKAVELYNECKALPVVPPGELNKTIGIEGTDNRCGYVVCDGSIWIQTSGRSTCKRDEDFREVSELVWKAALKEAEKFNSNKTDGKIDKNT